MATQTVSVIILSYNTKDLLHDCLQAVYGSKDVDINDIEVIVVDNNSSDGSWEIVSKKFPQVKLIRNKINVGYSAGNNIGIKAASGSYLLLLNSDVIVEPQTVKNMVDFIKKDSTIGAATCRVELPDGKLDWACHRGFPTPWNACTYFAGFEKLFPHSRVFAGYHQGWKNLSKPHDVDVIVGAFFLIRREVIEKVGLLDEQFFMYGEDIDWCYRIKQAGFRIMFNPESKVLHYKKQSGRARSQETGVRNKADYHFVYTMEQFYRKHYMKKYPRVITELVFAVLRLKKSFL